MFRNKYFQKFLIVSFLIFSSVSFAPRRANANIFLAAQWGYNLLKPGGWGSQTINYLQEEAMNKVLDIRRTIYNMFIASTHDVPLGWGTGRTGDEVSACYLLSADIYDPATSEYIPTWSDAGVTNSLASIAGDPELEQVVQEAYELLTSSEDPHVCNFNSSHAIFEMGEGGGAAFRRGSGSMLAVASTMNDVVVNEPLPVNLAHFTKDYARRIPIIKNTAYAQTDYNIIGEQVIYVLWQITRNLSLALMSLVLLVVGVMIMTRKKINAQAVVTVQNALPRIAVGIALIFFSYPIGALFAALVAPLSKGALGLFFTLTGDALASAVASGLGGIQLAVSSMSLNTLVISLYGVLYNLGPGLFASVGAVVVLIVAIVILIIIYVRAVFIYIKILMNIVFAPIQFALGVIPGKENSTIDWFKSMLADVLSVPAMFLMVALAFFFLWASFISNIFGVTSDAGDLVGRSLVLLFTPAVMFFCLMTALKMPGKVQKMVMGDKKR